MSRRLGRSAADTAQSVAVAWAARPGRLRWPFWVGPALSCIAFAYMAFDPTMQLVGSSLVEALEWSGLAIVGGLVGYRLFWAGDDRRRRLPLGLLFLYALVFRLVWAIMIYVWSTGVGRGGAVALDDSWYFELGSKLADSLRMNVWPDIPSFGGYYVFNAFVDLVSGGCYFATLAINTVVGSLVVIYVYRLAALLYDQRTAWWAAVLVAATPELAMWSATNLKDIHVILCIVITTFEIVRFRQSRRLRLRSLLVLAAANLYVASMRPVFTIFVVVFGCAYLLLASRRLTLGRVNQFVVGATVLVLILAATGYYPGGPALDSIGKYDTAKLTLESSFSPDSLLGRFNPVALRAHPYLLPPALAVDLITPFPFWRLIVLPTTAEPMLTSPGVMFWTALIPAAFFGAWVSIRRNWRTSLPVWGWAAFLWLASTLEGGGAIFRYRASLIPFALILAAVGLAESRRWRWVMLFYGVGYAGVCVLYLCLK